MFGKIIHSVAGAATKAVCIGCVAASTAFLAGCGLVPERNTLRQWADNNDLLTSSTYQKVTMGGGLSSYPRLVAETATYNDAMSSVDSLRGFLRDRKEKPWEVRLSWPNGQGRSELQLSQWSNLDAPALKQFGHALPQGATKQVLALGGKATDYRKGTDAELTLLADDPVTTSLALPGQVTDSAESYRVFYGEAEERMFGLSGDSVTAIAGAARTVDAVRTAIPGTVLSHTNSVSVPTIDDVFTGYFASAGAETAGARVAGSAITISSSTVSISTATLADDVRRLRDMLDAFGVQMSSSATGVTNGVRVGVDADRKILKIHTGASHNPGCPEEVPSPSRRLLTDTPDFSQNKLTLSGCWKKGTSWLVSGLDRSAQAEALPALAGILDEPAVTEAQIFGNKRGRVFISVDTEKLATRDASASDEQWAKIMPLIRQLLHTDIHQITLQEHRGANSDTSADSEGSSTGDFAEVTFTSTPDGKANQVAPGARANKDRVHKLVELWNGSAGTK